jgi:hypothetical protein
LAVFLTAFLADGLADPEAEDALLATTFFPPFLAVLEAVFLMLLVPAAAFLGALLMLDLTATLAIKKVSNHVKLSRNLSPLCFDFHL